MADKGDAKSKSTSEGKKPQMPNRKEMMDRVAELQQEMRDLRARADNYNQQPAVDPVHEAGKKTAHDNLQATTRGIGSLQKDRGAVMRDLGAARRERSELIKQLKELTKHGHETVESLEAEIRKLEFQLETCGSTSLKRERGVMQRIKTLAASKPDVARSAAIKARLDVVDATHKDLTERANTVQGELDKLRLKHEADYAALTGFQVSNGRQEAIKALADEREAIWKEWREKKEEVQEVKTNFENANKEYNLWLKEEEERERKKKEEARIKAQQEREAKAEEFRKKQQERRERQKMEERRRKMSPFEDEIVRCNEILAYLTAETRQAERDAKVAEFNPDAVAREGMKTLKKSAGEEDSWLFGDRTKKKAPKCKAPKAKAKKGLDALQNLKPKAPVKQTKAETGADGAPKASGVGKKEGVKLLLPPHQAGGLRHLQIMVPRWSGDIPEVVALLKERLAFYESKKKTLAQIEEEEKQEEEEREAREAARRYAAEQAKEVKVVQEEETPVDSGVENITDAAAVTDETGEWAVAAPAAEEEAAEEAEAEEEGTGETEEAARADEEGADEEEAAAPAEEEAEAPAETAEEEGEAEKEEEENVAAAEEEKAEEQEEVAMRPDDEEDDAPQGGRQGLT